MAGEEILDGMMVGMIAELALHDADNLTSVGGRIEVRKVEDVAGHGVGIDVTGSRGRGRGNIQQAEHPLLDKAAGLAADRGTVETGLCAARADRFSEEHDGANDLVVMLNGVQKAELERVKIGSGIRGHQQRPGQKPTRGSRGRVGRTAV